ncbi:flavodoxin family protein [Bacillus thuringiensis]|uniref:Flavodoxin family protein n=1 Tax=Bacillus thuringiensis TaxID=1428 RepID=A0AB36TR34_BACTU|nr:flavodoxin family protein [Bacillus thuringiensis]OPD49258.1 NADPH-dependent FMN reductase [Bacillus thuringiensis]PEA13109.1 flavodoxin family protein [Bacillus thuringiensis]PEE64588.1 flavodoxin family protein [Bacillus thuringiensis]PEE88890.1 flavodoxin family protein [Bacillus thuringiensis]PFB87237.1 flavodoxin family protein [Bacillus thuringiensis]
MKKKVFAYVGSRNPQSRLTLYVERMLTNLAQKNEVDYDLYTADKTNINHSTGCKNCFNAGFCELDKKIDDHMDIIKQKMLEADFIILASPVYSHNVSGDMKALVDRLSYWCHLMRLAGKPGIVVASAESNGSIQVLSYLEKIACCLGISVIERIGVVQADSSSEERFVEYIDLISKYLTGEEIVKSNQSLEKFFKTMQWVYSKYPEDHVEHLFWKNNGLLECQDFQEVLDKQLVLV